MVQEKKLVKNVKEGLEEVQEHVSDMIHKVWPFRTKDEQENEVRETMAFPVDICETEEGFVVVAEMPGVNKKGVNIQVSENELTISGQLQCQLENGEQVVFREIAGADYRRTFTLSDAVDREKVSAELKNGLLTVNLSKSERLKPRVIEIAE